MREIKFRAWSKQDNEMMEWGDAREVNIKFIEESKHSIFMQYTGLKDKNGVEIYEDDIVEVKFFGKYVVKYYGCSFYLQDIIDNDIESDENRDLEICAMSEECESEVIGNIYEHPHLLEVENV